MQVTIKLKYVFIIYSYIIQKKGAKCEHKKVELETPIRYISIHSSHSHLYFEFESDVYSVHNGGLQLFALPREEPLIGFQLYQLEPLLLSFLLQLTNSRSKFDTFILHFI